MSHPSITTATVIGGGIGGLSMALALRQVGIQATVYERAEAFGEVGAGISLWPNATRVLRRLGVLDEVAAQSGPIAALNVRNAAGRVLSRTVIDTSDAPALCAYRPALIDALAGALPPDACVFGKETVSAETRGDRAVAHFADGSSAEADLLIGADGLRSAVRAYVQPDADGPIYRGYPVYRGIAPLPAAFSAGEIFESWGDGQRFGLLDLGDGRAYWYATFAEPERPGRSAAGHGRLLDRYADWHAPIPETIAQTPAEALLHGPTYDRSPRRGWHRGRVVLAGDAAHPTTPNLGQGGGMAIEDAPALARCLEAHPVPEALRRFERERYRRTARVTAESLRIGRLALVQGLPARLLEGVTRIVPNRLMERRLNRLMAYDPA
jgi:2-polyprenyl-6-methoxyphenol hydroxylase-like FAD-dependent oxidoreductase